jgi:biotin carboxyl carrier protein
VKAHVVGTFHPRLKPEGKILVTVGDLVKAGQIVGTIEALSLLNEVEATVTGCVKEICVHENQPVEYGQILMTIDPSVAET